MMRTTPTTKDGTPVPPLRPKPMHGEPPSIWSVLPFLMFLAIGFAVCIAAAIGGWQ